MQEQVETADKALAAQLEAEKAQPRAKQQRDRRAPEGAAARHALKLQQHTDGYPAKDAQQKDKEKVCTHLCVCVCVCVRAALTWHARCCPSPTQVAIHL